MNSEHNEGAMTESLSGADGRPAFPKRAIKRAECHTATRNCTLGT
jgi:hypothetical protein